MMDLVLGHHFENSLRICVYWELWTYNCVKEFEKVLKLGRRPVKLLCDKSNTVRFAEVLKIDVGTIEPLKWFELKFLEATK
jgi:hypothetical protein